MPDYRKLYFSLMSDVESALRILINAQQKCEELVLSMEEEEEREAKKNAPRPPLPPPIQLFPEKMPFSSVMDEDGDDPIE